MPIIFQHQQFLLRGAVSDILCQLCVFKNTHQRAGVQEYPIVVNRLFLLNLHLCKTIDDLKWECTYTACLRAIVHEVTRLVIVVAWRIQTSLYLPGTKVALSSVPLFCWENVCPMRSLCLASSSTPAVFISWQFLVSPNPTFYVDQTIQCWYEYDRILISDHVVSIP